MDVNENPLPVAVVDYFILDSQNSVTIDFTTDLLGNDYDPDGDPISFVSFTQPNEGTIVDNEDGTLTYTSENTLVSSDIFTYTIQDDSGGESTATVVLMPDATSLLAVLTMDDDDGDLILDASASFSSNASLLSFSWYLGATFITEGTNRLVFTEEELQDRGFSVGDVINVTVEVNDGVATDSSTLDVDIVERPDVYEIEDFENDNPDNHIDEDGNFVSAGLQYTSVESILMWAVIGSTPEGFTSKMGHHHFSKSILTGVTAAEGAGGFSDEVVETVWGAVTGEFKDGVKHLPHDAYNKHLKGLLEEAIEGGLDPKLTTKAHAEQWIDNIINGKNPFSGAEDDFIKKFVNNTVKPQVDEILRPGTWDDRRAWGRRWQNTSNNAELGKLRRDMTTQTALAKKGDKKAIKKLSKLKRRSAIVVKRAKRFVSLGFRQSKHLNSVIRITSKAAKAIPIIGTALIMVVSWKSEVEAHGKIEGTARVVPVLGDLIVIAVDGKEIVDAVREINKLGDQVARGIALDERTRKQNVNQELRNIIDEYSQWEVEYFNTTGFNKAQANQLGEAVKQLRNKLDNAITTVPGNPDNGGNPQTETSKDSTAIQSAKQEFETNLKNLGFTPPEGPQA